MKTKLLSGILLAISLLFSACSVPVPESNLKYVEFGIGGTRAGGNFFWNTGDLVCIYSLVDGEITYKDTVTIKSPHGNGCGVRGLVDVNSTQYFFTYPMNGITDEIGDVLNDRHFRLIYGSTDYRGSSIMTAYVDPGTKNIWFEQRLSLLNINEPSGTVTIESSLPVAHTFSGVTGDYYIPLSDRSENVTIVLESGGVRKTKNMSVVPGRIYTAR